MPRRLTKKPHRSAPKAKRKRKLVASSAPPVRAEKPPKARLAPDPALLSLSTRIRELRKAARLTQEELAVRAGISLAFASMLERAARSASIETLAKVARALGVPLAELFRTRPDMAYDDPYFERLLIFARLAQLNHRDVERLIEVACAMFEISRERIPPKPEPLPEEPVTPCTVSGCDRPALAKGLCASHYHAQRREERS